MKNIPINENDPECLAENYICDEKSIEPEIGIGILPPLWGAEATFNRLVSYLPVFSSVFLALIALLITGDILGRLIFNLPVEGVIDIESLLMCVIGFGAMTYTTICRQDMQIDLFYNDFQPKVQRTLHLMTQLICCAITGIIGFMAVKEGISWSRDTMMLGIPESPFIVFSGIALLLSSIAFLFQGLHALKSMCEKKEFIGILISVVLLLVLALLPVILRLILIKPDGLIIGIAGFCLLMTLLLLRVPLGFAMCTIGFIGMLILTRRPEAVFINVGSIPFLNTTEFTLIAFPMFMLMGEMTFRSGLAEDLFTVAHKWLGRLPGGLAIASVGGCAGFGAVCGDSLATVITMASVALPSMQKNNYDNALATGALAAGGTLGILIPPSMGFIIYSMITEESVGKLFVAGILPGILLCSIFIAIIILQVIKNPTLAPKGPKYPLKEKLQSLILLVPVIVLFTVVVGGILYGFFTPAEGGALGAVLAVVYAFARKKMNLKSFRESILKSAIMFGKFFALFVGLYVFSGFLATSRLPNLLSDFIVGMDVNRYIVLGTIILVYIFLGCVMNIIPMMMLTLPSIYPTVEALGFNGIWFGVICVIIMEMGMITPPVGMNVFTMSSLVPEIPMVKIFKGVLPFFLGMLLCVILIIIFPDIALILVKDM